MRTADCSTQKGQVPATVAIPGRPFDALLSSCSLKKLGCRWTKLQRSWQSCRTIELPRGPNGQNSLPRGASASMNASRNCKGCVPHSLSALVVDAFPLSVADSPIPEIGPPVWDPVRATGLKILRRGVENCASPVSVRRGANANLVCEVVDVTSIVPAGLPR